MKRAILIGGVALFFVQAVHAHQIPVTPSDIHRAAQDYDVPERAILALLTVEYGQIGTKNYSDDLGPMQINAPIWLPTLRQFDITRHELRYHGPVNVRSGAWILRGELEAMGYTEDPTNRRLWRAIGNYHYDYRVDQDRHQTYVQRAWDRLNAIELDDLITHINEPIKNG